MTEQIHVLENTLKYLRFFLIWPEKDLELTTKKMFYFKFMLLVISTSFMLYGSVAHMIVALYEQNGTEIDLDIAAIISLAGTYYFNFSYLSKVEEIYKIFKDFTNFETFEAPPGYQTLKKKWNKLSTCHFIYYVIAIMLCFFTSSFIEAKRCLATNAKKGINEVCGLIFNVWLPFEFDYFPFKQIICFYQVYAIYFSYVVSSTISFSIMESIEHVIFRLDFVKTLFVNAMGQHDEVIRRHMFYHAIQYHNFVISLAQRLNKCYKACIFVHILFTGVILGCVGFQLTQDIHLITIELFVGWYLSLIMVASRGQRLMDVSTAIGTAIYSTNWYDTEIELQKSVILVLVRCQKPVYLSAGSFGFMSFQMILTILKTSYSIVTVMKATSLTD